MTHLWAVVRINTVLKEAKMTGRLLQEITVPPRQGAAFEVKRGQIIRVVEVEGPQVGDFNAFNLHNFRERLDAPLSAALNGSFRKFTRVYTNAPRGNLMFTVVDDKTGVHYLSGSHCTRLHYEIIYGVKDYHPNCYDILAEAVKPYGLSHYDVHGVFNFFMNVVYDENGRMIIKAPVAKKGDYMDIRAEMDVLCAIAACPGDIGLTNGEDMTPRPLKIEVYEEQ